MGVGAGLAVLTRLLQSALHKKADQTASFALNPNMHLALRVAFVDNDAFGFEAEVAQEPKHKRCAQRHHCN